MGRPRKIDSLTHLGNGQLVDDYCRLAQSGGKINSHRAEILARVCSARENVDEGLQALSALDALISMISDVDFDLPRQSQLMKSMSEKLFAGKTKIIEIMERKKTSSIV